MRYLLIIYSLFSFSQASIDEDKFEYGKEIYEQTCISCHGKDGKANTNMQLIVKPRNLSKTLLNENQTYLITKYGARHWGAKADIMPAFRYVYNEEQLRAVTYYISKQFNPNVEQRIKDICKECEQVPENKKHKMLKRGKKIFKRNCSWCHGIDGKGNGLATKNPTDSIFPYDLTKTLLTKQQIFLYVKYGGQNWGTHKDDMPSWKKKYDDFTIRSVARYIDEELRKKD